MTECLSSHEGCPSAPSPLVSLWRTRVLNLFAGIFVVSVGVSAHPRQYADSSAITAADMAPDTPVKRPLTLPLGSSVLGKTFQLEENGPEVSVFIKNMEVHVTIGAEEFLLQKIDGQDPAKEKPLVLDTMTVAGAQPFSSLSVTTEGVTAAFQIPLVTSSKETFSWEQLQTLVEDIQCARERDEARNKEVSGRVYSPDGSVLKTLNLTYIGSAAKSGATEKNNFVQR